MPRRAPRTSRKALLTVGLAMAVGVLAAAGATGPTPSRTSWSQDSAQEPAQQEPPAEPAVAGPPRMEVEGRFFTAGGEPLFWLGDTAWALLGKLDRADTVRYLDARSEQGYNVIQTVAIFPQAGANRPIRGDVSSAPDHGAFWDDVDFVIDAAAERGMYLAIHPVWGDKQTGSVVDEGNARGYGRFLGERFGDRDNVTWTLGGDHPAGGEERLWGNLAEGLQEGGATQLTTYHPQGDQTSAQWFAGSGFISILIIEGALELLFSAVDMSVT